MGDEATNGLVPLEPCDPPEHDPSEFQPPNVTLDKLIARMRADLLEKHGIAFKVPELPPYPRTERQRVKIEWFNGCLELISQALLEIARANDERMKAYEVAMALPPSTMGEA